MILIRDTECSNAYSTSILRHVFRWTQFCLPKYFATANALILHHTIDKLTMSPQYWKPIWKFKKYTKVQINVYSSGQRVPSLAIFKPYMFCPHWPTSDVLKLTGHYTGLRDVNLHSAVGILGGWSSKLITVGTLSTRVGPQEVTMFCILAFLLK